MSLKGSNQNKVQAFAQEVNRKPLVSVEQQVLDKVIKDS